jgi:hypothetical protein
VKISSSLFGVAFGVLGLAGAAQADVFNSNHPVTELHSVGGANTAGSFAASAMMGMQGHSALPTLASWESAITSKCATDTGSSVWPGGCNPTGMSAALQQLAGRDWITQKFASTDQTTALSRIVVALEAEGSPAVVPIYGQADHWVAITQVTATASGSNWNIGQVKFYDGGPVGGADGGGNSYEGGLLSYSGSVWKNVYFMVIENINPSCDPCTSDPFYNQYVITWEPHVQNENAKLLANFLRAPGVSNSMSEARAQAVVFDSLTSAGVNNDATIWNAISGTRAGRAVEVNGVTPFGERWDYFLVPLMAGNQTVAFVQLAADDGAFETVHVLPQATQLHPVSQPVAELKALSTLRPGETLSPAILTWDPRAKTPFAKAPTFPYYEFAVNDKHQQVGVVRVSLDDGALIRSAQ